MNYIIILLILIIFCLIMYLGFNILNFEKFDETNKFKNVILLIVFNYADCVHNIEKIKKLYKSYFKDIIFYSDIPHDDQIEINSEVNYLSIKNGFYTHKIFKHFYNKYKDLINQSDGLFYTMDDNIINVKELNIFTPDKIIYYYDEQTVNDIRKIRKLDNWGHWENNILTMDKISEDPLFKNNFDNNIFVWSFSDWFYLPKKYLNDKLFDLFELFGKYELFLEIAIPTAIYKISYDENDYQKFKDLVLWYGGEREYVKNKDYVYKALKEDKYFIIHPIKFNSNPEALIWLDDIFNN